MSRQEAKHWCFTLNNPISEDTKEAPPYQYLIIGNEVGASNTPHLQGYIILKTKARLTAMKKWITRAHFEVARGTPQEASDYCKKEGDYHEDGELPDTPQVQGGAKRKAQFEEAYQLAREGKRNDIDKELLIKYDSAFRRIENEHRPIRPTLDDEHTAIWIWGPPGVGKSRYVRDKYTSLYVKNANKWFTGYVNQDYVLIEDVDPKTMEHSAHFYKLWFDRYPIPVETKGGETMIRPIKFIVTSNYSIEECFNDKDAPAIRRRCEVIHMLPPLSSPPL